MFSAIVQLILGLLKFFMNRETKHEIIDPGPTIRPSESSVFRSLGLRGDGEDGDRSSWTTSSGTREPGDERPDSGRD